MTSPQTLVASSCNYLFSFFSFAVRFPLARDPPRLGRFVLSHAVCRRLAVQSLRLAGLCFSRTCRRCRLAPGPATWRSLPTFFSSASLSPGASPPGHGHASDLAQPVLLFSFLLQLCLHQRDWKWRVRNHSQVSMRLLCTMTARNLMFVSPCSAILFPFLYPVWHLRNLLWFTQ